MAISPGVATAIGRVLTGWFLSLFTPAGSVRSGPVDGSILYAGSAVSARLIAEGMEGLMRQYGARDISNFQSTDTFGGIRLSTSALIRYCSDDISQSDPCLMSLLHYVNLAYGDEPGFSAGVDIPFLIYDPESEGVVLSPCGSSFIGPNALPNPTIPPFFKVLAAMVATTGAIYDTDERSAYADGVVWWMGANGLYPKGVIGNTQAIPLPTFIRIQLRKKALLGDSDDSSLRGAVLIAVLGLSRNTQIIAPDWAMKLCSLLRKDSELLRSCTSSYYRGFNLRTLSGSLEALGDDIELGPEPTDEPKAKKAKTPPPKDGDDPDEGKNAYRSDDSDVSDTIVTSKNPDGTVSDNAIDTGNSGNDDTIDLIPLTPKGNESGNAFYYRRAVLALRTALENDPDANVSTDVRKTLNLWCQYYLFLADISSVKRMMDQSGLSKLLTPIGSSV